MRNLSESSSKDFPKLEYPKLEWHWEFLLAAVPFLAGFLLYYLPNPTSRTWHIAKDVAMACLFALPVLGPASYWVIRRAKVTKARASYYPSVRSQLISTGENLDELRREFFELLQALSGYQFSEVSKATFFNSSLYISFKRNGIHPLSPTDRVAVIDTRDAMLMGVFEVTEVRQTEYYAEARRGTNPLLISYVRQEGEVSMLPHLAVLIPSQGEEL